MGKFYIYKMIVDNGGAPCVQDNLLSLAICKPMIRSAAREGSILLAFAANELSRDNRLIYIARVTSKVNGRDYYSQPKFEGRADSIYAWEANRFALRPTAKFHPDDGDLVHDLGHPPDFKRAWVILSEGHENYRYFSKSPLEYKRKYEYLQREIESLMRGHRVNHDAGLRKELEELSALLFATPFAAATTSSLKKPARTKCHHCAEEDDFVEC